MYIVFCGWFIFPFTNLLMCARRWRREGQFCGGETRHLRVALVGRGRPEDAAKCRRMSWLQMACRHLWMIITMMNNHRIITIIVIILMIITVIWMIIYWYYDHGMKNDEQSTIQWWTEGAIWSYGYPYSLDIPYGEHRSYLELPNQMIVKVKTCLTSGNQDWNQGKQLELV